MRIVGAFVLDPSFILFFFLSEIKSNVIACSIRPSIILILRIYLVNNIADFS